jgi:hypothetical protein
MSRVCVSAHNPACRFAQAGYALLTLSQLRANEAREKAAKAAQTSASAA